MGLSKQAISYINKTLKKFPENQKRSAIISSLMFVQNENSGYLTNDLIKLVANYLELPEIAVYEVATFYSMFELKAIGKYKINVCTNVSCMLCGSKKIANYLKNKLGIDFGETTKDGRFTLKSVECLAACGGAPTIQLNDKYHEKVTPEKIDELLEGLK